MYKLIIGCSSCGFIPFRFEQEFIVGGLTEFEISTITSSFSATCVERAIAKADLYVTIKNLKTNRRSGVAGFEIPISYENILAVLENIACRHLGGQYV